MHKTPKEGCLSLFLIVFLSYSLSHLDFAKRHGFLNKLDLSKIIEYFNILSKRCILFHGTAQNRNGQNLFWQIKQIQFG